MESVNGTRIFADVLAVDTAVKEAQGRCFLIDVSVWAAIVCWLGAWTILAGNFGATGWMDCTRKKV